MRARAALVFGLALAAACKGNDLGGSIGDSYALDFDEVQVRKVADDILVEYLKLARRGAEKPCKLVVDASGVRLQGGLDFPRARFAERVLVQRVALEGGDFPAVDHGELHFDDAGGDAGDRMTGGFDVIFTTGRSLHGSFDRPLVVVDLN